MSEGLTIRRLDSTEYIRIFGRCQTNFFNSPEFAILNSRKTETVEWLGLYDEKGHPRAGLICGATGGVAEAPFSAPYAFFTIPGKLSAGRWVQLADALSNDRIDHITLPPLCYGEDVQKAAAALIGTGWTVEYADTNYHIDLSRDPEKMLSAKARGHLRKALKSGVIVEKLNATCPTDIDRAYSIIKRNRDSRGFALRMSGHEVEETLRLCGGQIYVASVGELDIASAIIYTVALGKAQLIYWGDTREQPEVCAMYALATEMSKDLKVSGYKMVDLGPSSSRGIVAGGQCDFKESVGGEMSLKFRLRNPHGITC